VRIPSAEAVLRPYLEDAQGPPQVRPDENSKYPEKTLAHYCVYVEAIKQHVYTPAYVQKLVELLSTEEGYRQTVGTAPRRKVTTLPTAKKATPAFGTSSCGRSGLLNRVLPSLLGQVGELFRDQSCVPPEDHETTAGPGSTVAGLGAYCAWQACAAASFRRLSAHRCYRICRCECLRQLHDYARQRQLCMLGAAVVRVCARYHS